MVTKKEYLEACMIYALLLNEPMKVFEALKLNEVKNKEYFLKIFFQACFDAGFIKHKIEQEI